MKQVSLCKKKRKDSTNKWSSHVQLVMMKSYNFSINSFEYFFVKDKIFFILTISVFA